MHYYMPKKGVLSLHSGCNMGRNGDVSLFFGLSGEQRTGYCVGSIAISLKPVG
jgi:phosphoenolpyruvate carboxykinase (ATP)